MGRKRCSAASSLGLPPLALRLRCEQPVAVSRRLRSSCHHATVCLSLLERSFQCATACRPALGPNAAPLLAACGEANVAAHRRKINQSLGLHPQLFSRLLAWRNSLCPRQSFFPSACHPRLSPGFEAFCVVAWRFPTLSEPAASNLDITIHNAVSPRCSKYPAVGQII